MVASLLAAVGIAAFLAPPPGALPGPSSSIAARTAVRHAAPRCTATLSFDEALDGVLADAKQAGSVEEVLDPWLDKLDENFIPTLASKIEVAPAGELPQLNELMSALQTRSQQGFERARDQLQSLLGAGEINKMDAQLSGLVRRNEVDAGLFYVLMRNMQDAEDTGDEGGARLMRHLYTRLQEELEKKTEPALALLHKLTRTDNAGIRQNLLRHNLVPQTETLLPDGSKLPMNPPVPALVEPMKLASVIEEAIDKVLSMPIDRAAIEATAEDIRQVAKEAHRVVADEYPEETLVEFQDALTPAFTRALGDRRETEASGEPRLMEEDE